MVSGEGTRVQIRSGAGYNNKYLNYQGTIERERKDTSYADPFDSIGVRLDGLINPASQYGLFWFKRDCLKAIENKKKR